MNLNLKNWRCHSADKLTSAPVTHKGVVEADVSLQTTLPVLKLHDRHFSCCDGQDVPQTYDLRRSDSVLHKDQFQRVIEGRLKLGSTCMLLQNFGKAFNDLLTVQLLFDTE